MKFVVLTSSRTGSTWLIDRLNMQAGIEAHGELFLGHGRRSPALTGRSNRQRFVEVHGTPGLTRVRRVFAYLDELYESPCTVGFKLMYKQLRMYPEMLLYLAMRRVRVIHLTRCNHIDVIVSEELARLTGISHTPAGSNAAVPAVHLNAATLIDHLHSLDRRPSQVRLMIRLIACPILEVTYEALLDGQEEFARILQYVGISSPPNNEESILRKRGIKSHRDSIANYDEIKQVLNSTSFSSMLR